MDRSTSPPYARLRVIGAITSRWGSSSLPRVSGSKKSFTDASVPRWKGYAPSLLSGGAATQRPVPAIQSLTSQRRGGRAPPRAVLPHKLAGWMCVPN
ncbi:hypothetical protein GCM10009678_80710 [Actinomadura kijaniata]